MCKNCGCGSRKPSKYAKFIKEQLHVHDHEQDHDHADHHHDPVTGETIMHTHEDGHAHEHAHTGTTD